MAFEQHIRPISGLDRQRTLHVVVVLTVQCCDQIMDAVDFSLRLLVRGLSSFSLCYLYFYPNFNSMCGILIQLCFARDLQVFITSMWYSFQNRSCRCCIFLMHRDVKNVRWSFKYGSKTLMIYSFPACHLFPTCAIKVSYFNFIHYYNCFGCTFYCQRNTPKGGNV